MKYLFLDASENLTHIQTGTENGFNAETIDTNRDFAAKITEICDNMLKNAGWKQKDLTHLVVCTGPGSLTGLRVADGFLRALAMLLNIPLIGIDLFKWSSQTLFDKSFRGEARLVMPTLIDKAFEVKCHLSSEDAPTQSGGTVTKVAEEADCKAIGEPILIEKKDITSNVKTFGIRWSNESIERLDPTPEALHKIILEKSESAKSGIDEILKVLPLYIIPSQAERNFKGGDK